jgi:hypothetical protein
MFFGRGVRTLRNVDDPSSCDIVVTCIEHYSMSRIIAEVASVIRFDLASIDYFAGHQIDCHNDFRGPTIWSLECEYGIYNVAKCG